MCICVGGASAEAAEDETVRDAVLAPDHKDFEIMYGQNDYADQVPYGSHGSPSGCFLSIDHMSRHTRCSPGSTACACSSGALVRICVHQRFACGMV
jgi:hypothetical protein